MPLDLQLTYDSNGSLLRFVHCNFEAHASSILAIFNHAILNTTALYEYEPRSLETMKNWFAAKEALGFPVFGLVDAHERLVAFGSYGPFRAFPAFKYSIEHSIYVSPEAQGKGYGRLMLEHIIHQAKAAQYHVLIGGIDAENQGSIALHEKFGFKHSGTIKEAGFKFGRWLDLAFYQLILDSPHHPCDG